MAVRTVAAYQTIDGRCFPDKQQAYREDFQYLAQQMGNIKYKGTSLSQIEKYIESIDTCLAQMKELRDQIKDEEDAAVAKSFQA
jgi:hypothetical protein